MIPVYILSRGQRAYALGFAFQPVRRKKAVAAKDLHELKPGGAFNMVEEEVLIPVAFVATENEELGTASLRDLVVLSCDELDNLRALRVPDEVESESVEIRRKINSGT